MLYSDNRCLFSDPHKTQRPSPYRAVNSPFQCKNSQLMLYREIITVRFKIHTKHVKNQSVPHSKHSVSVIKTGQLILYMKIITVCFQIHTKHINALCWQNVVVLNVAVKQLRLDKTMSVLPQSNPPAAVGTKQNVFRRSLSLRHARQMTWLCQCLELTQACPSV
jgi:hypothetical protein